MSTTTDSSQTHATFVLERTYDAPVDQVWAAFAEDDAKKKWFGVESDDWEISEDVHDFRVGGHDRNVGTFRGQTESAYVSTYTDIVTNERVVYTYDMWLDGRHISTSVATVALEPSGAGTFLSYTEQGVHLDGIDTAEQREQGTSELLDMLGASLG